MAARRNGRPPTPARPAGWHPPGVPRRRRYRGTFPPPLELAFIIAGAMLAGIAEVAGLAAEAADPLVIHDEPRGDS